MNWHELTTLDQLDQAIEESKITPALIFKHSRSCSISKATLDRLERNWNLEKGVTPYFLDLLTYRSISNAIAEKFGVQHESPQVLIIDQGESVYDKSHFDINFQDIKSKLQAIAE
ncbi:MAG: bacillithiol system redox-active protein YtxJ [Cyclobacteriaceae bacterium]|nr:bacillithiol system redox-active protein YtxJ [Cyclobacteriaceae bacterium]